MHFSLLRKASILIVCLLGIPAILHSSETDDAVYGDISVMNYVTGRFSQIKSEMFVKLTDLKIPCNHDGHYLRKEAAESLKKMIDAFKKENPNAPVWITSSTRTFYDQKYIWEAKWNGQTKVDGKKLNETDKDPLIRSRIILKYSSMPGTSRHHWGTDFDFNVLTDNYFASGAGKPLYTWLVANASKYGFHQPYPGGRDKGYNEEKWHWSYTPLSKIFLKDWNRLHSSMDFIKGQNSFAGAASAWHLADEYVNSINKDCK